MLLEVTGLRKTFEDGTRALRDINLTAKKGEFIVILGPSGSGKTTLLRCINGLVLPNEGTINFAGHSIYSKGLANLRKKTGMIFQDFNLVENLSSLNNVLTGLLDSSNKFMSIFYMFSREQKLIALECLERVGLLHKAYMRVDQLSGGQKQRVGIARAITKKPLLLLADEPVASLDPLIAHSIMSLIKNIGREYDITIICNLHQVDLALKFSDRLIGIAGGKIVLDSLTKNVDKTYIKNIYRGHKRGLFFGDNN